MRIAWDSEHKQLRRSDGQLFGRLDTAADFHIGRDFVEDITLAEWHYLIKTTELPGGHKLDLAIMENNSLDAILITRAPADHLEIFMSAKAPEWEDKDSVEHLLKTVCETKGDKVSNIGYSDDYWDFRLHCKPDDRTTRKMFALQALCGHLLKLPERPRPVDSIKVDTVRQILLAGSAEALLGMQESSWLEVKSRGYEIGTFAGEVELAQDIARFANGREASLLVLGFRTDKKNGTDTLVKVTPLRLPPNAAVRYHEILDRRIYPPVEGLTIDTVEIRGGSLMLIGVPLQSDASQPFLVHGAIVDGRNEGSFISIIQRRREGSQSMSPAEIHALLAAGRSVLRGQQ